MPETPVPPALTRPEPLSYARERYPDILSKIEDFQTPNINMPLRQTAP